MYSTPRALRAICVAAVVAVAVAPGALSQPASASAATCAQWDVSGEWHGTSGGYSPIFVFHQSGTRVTGTGALPEGQWQGAGWTQSTNPLEGTLVGDHLSFVVTAPHTDGFISRGQHDATVTQGSVQGTTRDLNVPGSQSVAWSATGPTVCVRQGASEGAGTSSASPGSSSGSGGGANPAVIGAVVAAGLGAAALLLRLARRPSRPPIAPTGAPFPAGTPGPQIASVGAARLGGFEDSFSYGEGAGKATPGVSRAYEALVAAQSPQATRKAPLVTPAAEAAEAAEYGARAGWYPDPEDPRALRYWDGTRWTSYHTPPPATR